MIQKRIRSIIPVRRRTWERSGGLQGATTVSSYKHMEGTEVLSVLLDREYASYVDEGVEEHFMIAQPGRPMRWQDPEGMWHSRYIVRHPGQRAQNFKEQIQNIVTEELDYALGALELWASTHP